MKATTTLRIPTDVNRPPTEHETELVRLALIQAMPSTISIGPDDAFDLVVVWPEKSKACIEVDD